MTTKYDIGDILKVIITEQSKAGNDVLGIITKEFIGVVEEICINNDGSIVYDLYNGEFSESIDEADNEYSRIVEKCDKDYNWDNNNLSYDFQPTEKYREEYERIKNEFKNE